MAVPGWLSNVSKRDIGGIGSALVWYDPKSDEWVRAILSNRNASSDQHSTESAILVDVAAEIADCSA
jgi:hypothetical protein